MRVLLRLVPLLFLFACSQEPATGPAEVRWDREVCAHCSMSIGDARFAAQVRGGPGGKVYKFDDIGCAMVWLDDKPWKDDAGTEIWVADYENSGWLDARAAKYQLVLHSPMGYGLGAVKAAEGDVFDFAGAVAHIREVEKRDHIHGGEHQHDAMQAGGET